MACWLFKTEPSDYSFTELVRDKRCTWSGISNNTALIHLRAIKKGDRVLIYHTGNEKRIIGIAEVTSNPYPDPQAADPKLVVVDVIAKNTLKRPVTLQEIKADAIFAGWDLVRLGRLSVMPVPVKIWKRIEELSEKSP